MKKFPFLTLVMLLAIGLSSAQKKSKFVKLFNGEDLNNWTIKLRNGDTALAKKVFAVDKNTIHVFKDFPIEYELNDGKNNTHGVLFTKKKYSKYILKFEYKWGKGIANNFGQFQYDAGVFYHVVEAKIWPKSIEYQVRYNHLKQKNHTGDFWAPKIEWYSVDGKTFTSKARGGKLTIKPEGGEHLALKDVSFNALNNRWNSCEIIVMADAYVIHKLNGKVVNMSTNLPYKEGLIGFQSETAEIYYRNIKIKEFDTVIPIGKFIKEY